MSIHFPFELDKAIEVSALLVNLHGKPLKLTTLSKILFIAECSSLNRSEHSIIGGSYRYYKGDIVIYELTKSFLENIDLWVKYIDVAPYIANNLISFIIHPGNDNLCKLEEELLSETYNSFYNENPLAHSYLTGSWIKTPYPYFINFEDILKAYNTSQESIKYIRDIADRETVRIPAGCHVIGKR